MNDYREVLHGLDCLVRAYDHSHFGKTFKTTLDSMFEGFSTKIQHLFNSWIQNIQNHTYISCFSEHRPEDDFFGRLSMWRAYGVNTGAAFVLNNSAFQLSPDLLKVYASPVAYLSEEAFQQEFGRIVDNINAEVAFLKNQGQDKIMDCVFRMFRFAIVSTKNPCFQEENEWRLIYSPPLEDSHLLKKTNEIIQGVPQPIYHLPLEGIPGVEVPSFIDRIIIGPTQYPQALCEAFIDSLTEFRVHEPQSKVHWCKIPLRT